MIKPWKILNQKTTYSDQWLTLRTDRCETDSGKIIENYHVLEYPHWINIVGITAENQIITIREYRHGAGKVVLGLPAGAIDPKDPSPEICARRELEEETGYIGGNYYDIGRAYPNPAIQSNEVFSYLAIGVTSGGTKNFDPGENIEVNLISFEDILEQSIQEGLPFQSLHIAAFHQALMFILRSNHSELQILKNLIHKTFEKFSVPT